MIPLNYEPYLSAPGSGHSITLSVLDIGVTDQSPEEGSGFTRIQVIQVRGLSHQVEPQLLGFQRRCQPYHLFPCFPKLPGHSSDALTLFLTFLVLISLNPILKPVQETIFALQTLFRGYNLNLSADQLLGGACVRTPVSLKGYVCHPVIPLAVTHSKNTFYILIRYLYVHTQK